MLHPLLFVYVEPSTAGKGLARRLLVKVVKVKMVIFIFGLCHLLTIYKYKIFII